MSGSRSQSLPTFRSDDEEVVLTRPLSGWAVLSLAVGLACLLVPISLNLIPLSVLAVLFGLVLSWRLGRTDADSGRWMALTCLGLGIGSAVWCVTAHKTRSQHFSHHASAFAKEYMQLLSYGQLYNAIELRLPFQQRQPSDVDLAAYYETYKGEVEVSMNILGSLGDSEKLDPAKSRKTAFERLKVDPVTTYALRFPNADWKCLGIRNVVDDHKVIAVKVIMQATEDPKTQILIELMRDDSTSSTSNDYAEWRISSQEFDK